MQPFVAVEQLLVPFGIYIEITDAVSALRPTPLIHAHTHNSGMRMISVLREARLTTNLTKHSHVHRKVGVSVFTAWRNLGAGVDLKWEVDWMVT